jgi:hypothetical protein
MPQPETAPPSAAADAGAAQAQAQSATSPPVNPANDAAAAMAAVPPPSAAQGVSGPTTASDADVIEPEWVDKAEQTVASHQGDPYGEEEAVEDLQIDYLQKRYGYNVADPNGENSKSEGK